MEKEIYAVSLLKTKITIEVFGRPQELDMIFADGMVGVIPVFKDVESAVKYGGDNVDIYPIIQGKDV